MEKRIKLAKEYLELKKKIEQEQKRIGEIRNFIIKEIEQNGVFAYKDKNFSLQTRISYEYDPEKLKDIIGRSQYSLVQKVIVDKRKLKSLIKGGFIAEYQIQPAKNIVQKTVALIVKGI